MSDLPQAVCVVVRSVFTGKILAVTRPKDGHQLGLPAGKVELGELLEQAASRECFEETGVPLDPAELRPVAALPARTMMCQCYVVNSDFTGDLRSSEEGVPQWVDPDDLLTGPFADYNAEVFRLIMRQGWDWLDKYQADHGFALSSERLCELCGHAYGDHEFQSIHPRLGLWAHGRCWAKGCTCINGRWKADVDREAREHTARQEKERSERIAREQAQVDAGLVAKTLRRGKKGRIECFRCHRVVYLGLHCQFCGKNPWVTP